MLLIDQFPAKEKEKSKSKCDKIIRMKHERNALLISQKKPILPCNTKSTSSFGNFIIMSC